jgi:hypothetical protein
LHRTVAELGRMSTRELVEWEAFEEEMGPLLIHQRIDSAVAILAAQRAGSENVSDFLPRWEREGEAHIVDWLSAMARKS